MMEDARRKRGTRPRSWLELFVAEEDESEKDDAAGIAEDEPRQKGMEE